MHTHVQHLVIGDSLIRRVALPNSVTRCRGGGKPGDIIPYLMDNHHILPREDYPHILTVTLSCGTNSLSDLRLNLGDIMSDYDELLKSICTLFPNAQIALFNIPPRSYRSRRFIHRIHTFNDFLFDIARFCPFISYINLFRECLSPQGYLNWKLYRGDLLHFSHHGNMLLSHRISEFHRHFYFTS